MRNIDQEIFEVTWTEWHVELRCMHCGEFIGTLVQDEQHRNSHVVLNGSDRVIMLHGAPMPAWRCPRCGGPIIPGESDHVRRRKPTPRMYQKEPGDIPHRGRPSKALIEQRRREKELEDLEELEVLSA